MAGSGSSIKAVYKDMNNPFIPSMLSIVSSKKIARIYIDDIEMFEQVAKVLHIITADREYTVYENIDKIEKLLINRSFFRSLKCMLINFDQVREMDGNYIIFQSGREVTMGRNAVCRTRNAYRKYLIEYPPFIAWEPRLQVAENVEDNI